MEKKEYVLSFIEEIKKGNVDGLFHYLTNRTVFCDLDKNEILDLQSFIQYCKDNLIEKELVIKRVFESKVCIKVELLINSELNNFYFEIDQRRFSRIEFSK